MDNRLQFLSLIDLISEKHKVLRQRLHHRSGEAVNQSEAHTLAVLREHGVLHISDISRLLNISRQGAHKCVQGLLLRHWVEPAPVAGNSRDKFLVLTTEGREYCERMDALKAELEGQITEHIGLDNVELLKQLLKADWEQ